MSVPVTTTTHPAQLPGPRSRPSGLPRPGQHADAHSLDRPHLAAATCTVAMFAADPVGRVGIGHLLAEDPRIRLVDSAADAVVVVIALDDLDERAEEKLREMRLPEGKPIVAIVSSVTRAGLLAALDLGVQCVLRRAEANAARLAQSVWAAVQGDGSLPPDLVGTLISHVHEVQRNVLTPYGLTSTGLSTRELDVLRMLADGHDTMKVAKSLAYSERTVKAIIHDIITRLQARNRTHAVAIALRQGVI